MSTKSKTFRLSHRGLLLALISSAFAGSTWAQTAGTVDFASGDVTATGADGQARPVRKGVEIRSGDRIVTNQGRAQIRFTDGGYVSLQPDTDFSVRDYRFDGKADGSERGVFGLVKGAMRTVTGLIGRANRAAYQIQTPTATIGIRGTGGIIRVLDSGDTLVFGTSGEWFARNQKGVEISVPAGTGARIVPDVSRSPQRVSDSGIAEAPPIAIPQQGVPMTPVVFVAGEQRNQGGTLTAVSSAGPAAAPAPAPAPTLSCASGCEVAFASLVSGVGSPGAVAATVVPVPTLDAAGKLTAFDTGANAKALTGTQVDTGTSDGVVSWGRWTGGATLGGMPWSGFQTLAYVVGLPTPLGDLTSMTGSFTYNLIGSTAPTDGVTTGTVTGGSIVGTFGPSPTATISLNFTHGAGTYNLAGTHSVPGGGPYAPFGGAVSATGTGCGFSGCTATINGHFMGAGATHAGFAYKVDNFVSNIVGAAAFKR
jgi:hypothetical protein